MNQSNKKQFNKSKPIKTNAQYPKPGNLTSERSDRKFRKLSKGKKRGGTGFNDILSNNYA